MRDVVRSIQTGPRARGRESCAEYRYDRVKPHLAIRPGEPAFAWPEGVAF